jgi:hypothetical protein
MQRRLVIAGGVVVCLCAFLLFAGNHSGRPQRSGFLGLEFAPLTRAAQGRAPYLTDGGALIVKIVAKSPAAEYFKTDEIVTAIDSDRVSSPADAALRLDKTSPGQKVTLTYYDLAKGDGHRHEAVVVLAAAPPVSKKVFTVLPPRTVAREWDFEPSMAAGASWSKSIARGPVRPLALDLLSRGRCSALAPEDWSIADIVQDGTRFELVSGTEHSRAIFTVITVSARTNVESAVNSAIARMARIEPEASPSITTQGGYRIIDFGSSSGYAGFALYHARPYRMTGLAISIWIVAVPASNVATLAPVAGAVAFSIRCATPFDPKHRPFDDTISATSVSERCLRNDCDEGDFAGAYNEVMHTGYVHGADNDNYLIDPRKDVWATGPGGAATYRQVGGTLEKLDPGRTN